MYVLKCSDCIINRNTNYLIILFPKVIRIPVIHYNPLQSLCTVDLCLLSSCKLVHFHPLTNIFLSWCSSSMSEIQHSQILKHDITASFTFGNIEIRHYNTYA